MIWIVGVGRGHPNWYFRISKFFHFPHLDHPTVALGRLPWDDWFQGKGREKLPEPPAAVGVQSLSMLLPERESSSGRPMRIWMRFPSGTSGTIYLLQQRVKFETGDRHSVFGHDTGRGTHPIRLAGWRNRCSRC